MYIYIYCRESFSLSEVSLVIYSRLCFHWLLVFAHV